MLQKRAERSRGEEGKRAAIGSKQRPNRSPRHSAGAARSAPPQRRQREQAIRQERPGTTNRLPIGALAQPRVWGDRPRASQIGSAARSAPSAAGSWRGRRHARRRARQASRASRARQAPERAAAPAALACSASSLELSERGARRGRRAAGAGRYGGAAELLQYLGILGRRTGGKGLETGGRARAARRRTGR